MDAKFIARTVGVSLGVGVVTGVIFDRAPVWVENMRLKFLPEVTDEDWESMVQVYGPDEYYPDLPEGVNVVDEDGKSEDYNSLFEKPPMSSMVDYSKFYGSDQDGDHANVPKTVEEMVKDLPGVEIISEEDFVKGTGNLMDGYVSVTGTYFTQEKILAGWDSELEERDIETSVGFKAISLFEDPNVKAVYVRNEVLKVLYEILRCNDPYEETVMQLDRERSDDPSYSEEG